MASKEDLQKAIERLKERAPHLSCPMCGTKHFSLSEGYFVNNIMADLNTITFGGPAVPCIAAICNNCGFVSQHALGVLGLLPTPKNEPK